MKPKYRRFGKSILPTLIIVPAMAGMAMAATFAPDSTGDLSVVDPADSGANNIVTGFGFAPPIPAGERSILIGPDVTLSPTGTDVVEIQAFDSVGAFYTITNQGVLQSDGGASNYGISTIDIAGSAQPSITVNNSGTISGAGAIRANNQLILNNSGILLGTSGVDAAVFAKNGGTITNDGEIDGNASGIVSEAGALTINNNATGTISGGVTAIQTGGSAVIVNNGEISSNGVTAINALGGLTLTNTGEIFGDQIGVNIGGNVADSTITNSGSITGLDVAILGDDLITTINNSGLIDSDTTAIDLNGGDDVINLNDGSQVFGDVFGGAGNDTINFNGGLTSATDTTNNFISGDIEIETVNKTGAGVAFIGQPTDLFESRIDTINIGAGGLYINTNLLTGLNVAETTINAGGTALGGTGTWNANLNITAGGFSAGAIPINLDVNPVNGVGIVDLTGDVTHSVGSFIRMDIVSGEPIIDGVNSDLINQFGLGNVYNLNTTNLRISTTNANQVIGNGTYTIIDSDEAILGSVGTVGIQFNPNVTSDGPFTATESGVNALDTVFTNFFLTTGFADGGTNLVMTVNHNYAGLPGLTRNESALGAAIDASVGSSNALIQQFIASLDFSNLGAVQATLASLNPESYLSAASGIVNSNYRINRMTQDHLASVRSNSGVMRMGVGSQTDSKGAVIPAQTASPSNRGSFWGSTSYDTQDYDGDGANRDFDGETGAITAGFDYRVAPALVLGVLLDGSTSDFDSDAGGTDIDSFRVAVYGTWGEATGLYSDFLAGYGNHDLDIQRSLGGLLFGSNSASTDADSVQALWTIGYTMGDAQVKHGPFAGLEYQTVDVDGFEESGTLPLSVGDFDVESFRGLIGYRANATSGRFTPYASIAYAHEFESDGATASATFGGSGFTVRGSEQGSAILLTAGTGVSLTDSLTLDIGYRGEVSVDDAGVDSHGANLGLTYTF